MKKSLLLTLAFCAAAQAGALLGPSPYLQASDSPFATLSFDSFALENFEDGAFNLLNAGISGGTPTLAGGPFTDSVDGDDGAIDGSGNNGRSWYSENTLDAFDVTFSAVLGQFPTHAGLVWTDVGVTNDGGLGVGTVIFEAFAPGGASLGVNILNNAGDGLAMGGTAEDRFFGVINLAGVERIRISMPDSVDWEIDHIQFGTIPEPASIALVALMALFIRRR